MKHHVKADEKLEVVNAAAEKHDWKLYLLSPHKVESFYHDVSVRKPEQRFEIFSPHSRLLLWNNHSIVDWSLYRIGLIVRWALDPEVAPTSNLAAQSIFATTSAFNLTARDASNPTSHLVMSLKHDDVSSDNQSVSGEGHNHAHAPGRPSALHKKHIHACISEADDSNSEKNLFVLDFLSKGDNHKVAETRAIVTATNSIKDILFHISDDEASMDSRERKRREENFSTFVVKFMGDRLKKVMEFIMRLCRHHAMHRTPDHHKMETEIQDLRDLEPNHEIQLLLGDMGLLQTLVDLSENIASVLTWAHRPDPPFELKDLQKVDESDL